MKLYILIENGATKNHPALEDNLMQAFGEVPPHWEPFIRIERPVVGVYQLLESDEPIYTKVQGVWTDVWTLRNMTADEKNAKQQKVKDNWAAMPDSEIYADWFFEDEICAYRPPTL